MAKKGKAKISRAKRNNQTTNKMKKQGKLKLQRHRPKVQKQNAPPQQAEVYDNESDSTSEDEWADMLDDGEKQYILNRIAKQPQLLADVPEKEEQTHSRKRKRPDKEKVPKRKKTASDSGAESDDAESESDIENKYEQEMSDKPVKKLRPLLPIKTKQGLMERSEEVEDTDSESEEETPPPKRKTKQAETDSDVDENSDSGMEVASEDQEPAEGEADQDERAVTAVELLAARRDKLQHDKLRIGALCSSLLECPEKKIKNLYPILYLMEERLKDGTLNLHSIRKIATISTFEVFKDILPDYQIRHQDYSNIKLKKDTLALYKYEKELLEFYKRYLQRLEKATNALRPKKGDTRTLSPWTLSLALVSVRCLCGMLVARPQFNYATNIAQSVVPLLDSKNEEARKIVAEACVSVFNDDKKGEITLAIVRLINQLVKRRGDRLHPAALDCLLALKIRDVDLDQEADLKHKKKQDERHKKRIVNLSKKEKKRSKKLKEVERELLETEAQESELAHKKLLTEVTKTVFHIYFRLLKTSPGSKLLAAALQGLAKFTHVINLELYSSLVALLSRLLSAASLRVRERVLCARAVLAVLGGAGDALSVDPATFYQHLYCDMMECHAGATHSECRLIIESLHEFSKRVRRSNSAVVCAFAKRLLTFATSGGHNAALAALAIVAQLMKHCSYLQSLLTPDPDCAASIFRPLAPAPEHCGAGAAGAHELAALTRHYHAAVRERARDVAAGKWGSDKMTPMDIFDAYDGTQMALKPAVPPPGKQTNTKLKPTHHWAQPGLQALCEDVESRVGLEFKDKVVR